MAIFVIIVLLELANCLSCKIGWSKLEVKNAVKCIKVMEKTDNPLDTMRSRTWPEAEAECNKFQGAIFIKIDFNNPLFVQIL